MLMVCYVMQNSRANVLEGQECMCSNVIFVVKDLISVFYNLLVKNLCCFYVLHLSVIVIKNACYLP